MSERLLTPSFLDKAVGKVLMKLGKFLKNRKIFEVGFDLFNYGEIEG